MIQDDPINRDRCPRPFHPLAGSHLLLLDSQLGWVLVQPRTNGAFEAVILPALFQQEEGKQPSTEHVNSKPPPTVLLSMKEVSSGSWQRTAAPLPGGGKGAGSDPHPLLFTVL